MATCARELYKWLRDAGAFEDEEGGVSQSDRTVLLSSSELGALENGLAVARLLSASEDKPGRDGMIPKLLRNVRLKLMLCRG